MVLYVSYILQQRFLPFVPTVEKARAQAKRRRSAILTVDQANVHALALRKLSSAAKAGYSTEAAMAADVSSARQRRSSMVHGVTNLRKELRQLATSVLQDYNNLESTFLITALMILLSGMVFLSRGFPPGSVAFFVMTVLVAVVIVSCVAAFVALLSYEVFRSFRDARLHAQERQVEADRMEQLLLSQGSSARRRGDAPSNSQRLLRVASRSDRAQLVASAAPAPPAFLHSTPTAAAVAEPVGGSASAHAGVNVLLPFFQNRRVLHAASRTRKSHVGRHDDAGGSF
jgi:hypothetical protein